jgi:hypothetical protein
MSIFSEPTGPQPEPSVPEVLLGHEDAWAVTWRATSLTPDNCIGSPFVVEQINRMFVSINKLRLLQIAREECGLPSEGPSISLAQLLDQGVEDIDHASSLVGEGYNHESSDDPTGVSDRVALTCFGLAVLRAYDEHAAVPLPNTFHVPDDLV